MHTGTLISNRTASSSRIIKCTVRFRLLKVHSATFYTETANFVKRMRVDSVQYEGPHVHNQSGEEHSKRVKSAQCNLLESKIRSLEAGSIGHRTTVLLHLVFSVLLCTGF